MSHRNTKMLLPTIVSIIGVAITIIAFYVSNVERYDGLYKLIAPQHYKSKTAYNRLIETGAPIKTGEPGFQELITLIFDVSSPNPFNKDQIAQFRATNPDFGKQPVTEIKITKVSAVGSVNWIDSPYINLIITSENQSFQMMLRDLNDTIRARFGEPIVWRWSHVIFWLGVTVTAIGALLSWLKQ